MPFNVEVKLPSGRACRVEELSNKEYLSIIKYSENKDYIGLSRFFEERYIESDMHIIDRFYLLIYIRMLFIESSITLNLDEKAIEINLDTILNNLETNYIDLETKFEEGGIEVILDLPCITYYTTVDELFIATIKRIKVADTVVEFNKLSADEQQEIIDNLPATIFDYIKKFIETIQNNLLDLTIIGENKSIGLQKLSIEILGNGIMQFITNLFGTNLEGFYSLIYSFQNTIMPGSNYFFEMSPIETQIILNVHSKRIKEEQNKLQRKNNR